MSRHYYAAVKAVLVARAAVSFTRPMSRHYYYVIVTIPPRIATPHSRAAVISPLIFVVQFTEKLI